MDKNKMVEALNAVLEQEHACAIRYATHASLVTGPYAETIAARLKEIGEDEQRHAHMLRERIVALDGVPSMGVSAADLKPATTLAEMLKINIAEEHHALKQYRKIFADIPPSEAILYQAIQEIIRDEQEHLEELEALS